MAGSSTVESTEYGTRLQMMRMLIASRTLTAHFLANTDLDMDYLAPLFLYEVDQYRTQSFEQFGLIVNVLPASDAAPKFNSVGTFIGFEQYVVDTYNDPPKPMPIRLHSNDRVQVFYLGKWHAVTTFMKRVKLPVADSELSSSVGQFNQQWNWWMKNGKKFPLLDLPAEVRDIIYGFVFGQRIEPYPTCKARRRRHDDAPISAPQPTAALLWLNRQIREEASNICFSHTPFYVEHFGVCRRLVSNADVMKHLKRLQLSLSHYEFFKLFGYSLSEEVSFNVSRSARALRSLTLTILELTIAPPSLITESSALDGACQKTIVDWLLEAALPLIGLHPVKLNGYVKRKQKAAFEAACLVARKDFEIWQRQRIVAGLGQGTQQEYHEWVEECLEDEDGGVSLVGSEMVERRDVSAPGPKELPPRCRCTRLCSVETWTWEG